MLRPLASNFTKSGCCTSQRGHIYPSGFSRGIDFATVSSIFILNYDGVTFKKKYFRFISLMCLSSQKYTKIQNVFQV